MIVQDVDRPDVNGTPPKMIDICQAAIQATKNIVPFIKINANDNLMSTVSIRGSFDKKINWNNGVFENSCHFIFFITPQKGKRYYDPTDEKVTLELIGGNTHHIINHKHRKYTGTIDKVINRLKAWLEKGQNLRNPQ